VNRKEAPAGWTREAMEAAERERPLRLEPSSGPAPLAVELVWYTWPGPEHSTVTWTFGDGTALRVDGFTDVSHTYRTVGRHTVAADVALADGSTRRYTSHVEVYDPFAFEAELQGRWHTMRTRLAARDVPGALECVAWQRRADYERAWRLLGAPLQPIDDVYKAIRRREWRSGVAVYDMVRGRSSFDIRFAIDVDGVWRLSDF